MDRNALLIDVAISMSTPAEVTRETMSPTLPRRQSCGRSSIRSRCIWLRLRYSCSAARSVATRLELSCACSCSLWPHFPRMSKSMEFRKKLRPCLRSLPPEPSLASEVPRFPDWPETLVRRLDFEPEPLSLSMLWETSFSISLSPSVTEAGLSSPLDQCTSCQWIILSSFCCVRGNAVMPNQRTRMGAVVALMTVVRSAVPLT
mmetsp:Transcript_44114/g.125856  ORF Transcript_44114/g.125856 Transcript_44114/m.125856 type:complete len:203 (-) Transcript_44114:1429-2037(-)